MGEDEQGEGDADEGLASALFGSLEFVVEFREKMHEVSTSGAPNWKLGSNHSAQQWQNKMTQRGWTPDQITEAIQNGKQFPALNLVDPSNAATRYIHPNTGRSVVLDNVTEEVIHVGGDGFVY